MLQHGLLLEPRGLAGSWGGWPLRLGCVPGQNGTGGQGTLRHSRAPCSRHISPARLTAPAPLRCCCSPQASTLRSGTRATGGPLCRGTSGPRMMRSRRCAAWLCQLTCLPVATSAALLLIEARLLAAQHIIRMPAVAVLMLAWAPSDHFPPALLPSPTAPTASYQRPPTKRPSTNPPHLQVITEDFDGDSPYGDRRQEIVFIGVGAPAPPPCAGCGAAGAGGLCRQRLAAAA